MGTSAKASSAGADWSVPRSGCWDRHGCSCLTSSPHLLQGECLLGQFRLMLLLTVGYGPEESGLNSRFLNDGQAPLHPQDVTSRGLPHDGQVLLTPTKVSNGDFPYGMISGMGATCRAANKVTNPRQVSFEEWKMF